MAPFDSIIATLSDAIEIWLDRERDSLNTLAGAVVVLDMLTRKAPLSETDVFTQGGQVVGSRGSALRDTLRKYGVERQFLADGVTTRSTNKFMNLLRAIDNGKLLADIPAADRSEIVTALIAPLTARINVKTQRPPLEISFDHHQSLTNQIEEILRQTRSRSRGRIEQHLVGAKLERRFPGQTINRERAYAADMQTERTGDFIVRNTVYHVTTSPAEPLITKARMNLAGGLQPVLIVPRDAILRAIEIAIAGGIREHVMIFALEDFLAQNLLEMADAENIDHAAILESILDTYNQRIEEIENDQSLRIMPKDRTSNDQLGEDIAPDPAH